MHDILSLHLLTNCLKNSSLPILRCLGSAKKEQIYTMLIKFKLARRNREYVKFVSETLRFFNLICKLKENHCLLFGSVWYQEDLQLVKRLSVFVIIRLMS